MSHKDSYYRRVVSRLVLDFLGQTAKVACQSRNVLLSTSFQGIFPAPLNPLMILYDIHDIGTGDGKCRLLSVLVLWISIEMAVQDMHLVSSRIGKELVREKVSPDCRGF
jgi:Flp pilus assembly protein protease CpaA